jgi:hypothetical protein
MRLRRRLRKQATVESVDESPEEIGYSPLPGRYVNWANLFNYFSGTQSVMSELIETWRKRRSRHS